MTNFLNIQTIVSVCLVVVCLLLIDKIEGFSDLNFASRAFIDVIVILGALQLINAIVKFIRKHQ